MAQIEDVILFQIERTSKISKVYSQREFDKINVGITVDQWILLKIIQEKKELSQKELAKFSHRDPASITRTLDILETKGFIRRETISGNRRQYEIILSEKGEKFVAKHMKMVNEHRSRSLEGFSNEEMTILKDMLLRIQQNMK